MPQIKMKQIITEHWKTDDGIDRFNMYGIGEDGAVYKKISGKNRGWIKINMEMEFNDGEE